MNNLTSHIISLFILLTTAFLPQFDVEALDISGNVFFDSDFDGEKDPGEQGISGVEIRAINSSATIVGTAVTNGLGDYLVSGVASEQYRVELNSQSLGGLLPTGYGVAHLSQVRFVAGGTKGVLFGLSDPSAHCSADTQLAVPLMRAGSHQTATHSSLLTFPENAGSNAKNVTLSAYTLPSPTTGARAKDTGAIFGLAYSSINDTLYAGSFVKRHADLGPTRNPTTIYAIERSSGVVTPWITLDASRSDPHTGPIDVVTSAECPHCQTAFLNDGWFADFGALSAVMKEGLGDVELSTDQRTLYTIDLKTRQLVAVPINSDGSAGTPSSINVLGALAGLVGPASDQCPSTSDLRPFGIGVHRGHIYVGVVCSAQSTVSESTLPLRQGSPAGNFACPGDPFGRCAYDPLYVGPMTPPQTPDPLPGDKSRLRAYVVQIDEQTQTQQVALNFPLSYERGCVFDLGNCRSSNSINWRPWVDSFPYKADVYKWWHGTGAYYGTTSIDLGMGYPQPVLADITFDDDGSMILGIGDRFGHQAGIQFAPSPRLDGSTEYVDAVGDMLRACATGPGAWAMEKQISGDSSCSSGGISPVYSGGNSANLEEYYFEDGADSSSITGPGSSGGFKEHLIGNVLHIPGRSSTLVTSADVAYGAGFQTSMDDVNWLNVGVSSMDNTTGKWQRGYVIERGSPFKQEKNIYLKGNALGDLVALCDAPPVEIGDRVWRDINQNGVQDPAEPPIPGVTLKLYTKSGVLLATAVTNSDGLYLFSSRNRPSTDSFQYTLPLVSNAEYRIDVGSQDDYETGPLKQLFATVPQVIIPALHANTLNDSNGFSTISQAASGTTTTVYASFELVGAGSNDHSIDFGFTTEDGSRNITLLRPIDIQARKILIETKRMITARADRGLCGSSYRQKQREKDLLRATNAYNRAWTDVWAISKQAYTPIGANTVGLVCTQVDRSGDIQQATSSIQKQGLHAEQIYHAAHKCVRSAKQRSMFTRGLLASIRRIRGTVAHAIKQLKTNVDSLVLACEAP